MVGPGGGVAVVREAGEPRVVDLEVRDADGAADSLARDDESGLPVARVVDVVNLLVGVVQVVERFFRRRDTDDCRLVQVGERWTPCCLEGEGDLVVVVVELERAHDGRGRLRVVAPVDPVEVERGTLGVRGERDVFRVRARDKVDRRGRGGGGRGVGVGRGGGSGAGERKQGEHGCRGREGVGGDWWWCRVQAGGRPLLYPPGARALGCPWLLPWLSRLRCTAPLSCSLLPLNRR